MTFKRLLKDGQILEKGTELFETGPNEEVWIEPVPGGFNVHLNPDPAKIKPDWYMPEQS